MFITLFSYFSTAAGIKALKGWRIQSEYKWRNEEEKMRNNLCCCRHLDNLELKRLWLMKGSRLFGFFCTSGTWKQQDASGDLKHDQEIQLKCATVLTQHPALHGPWLLTANCYSPKSHTLLHNCRERTGGEREKRHQHNCMTMILISLRGDIFIYLMGIFCFIFMHAGASPRGYAAFRNLPFLETFHWKWTISCSSDWAAGWGAH